MAGRRLGHIRRDGLHVHPSDAEEGKAIRVQVSFTDDAGHAETLTSATTEAVTARAQDANALSLRTAVVDGAVLLLVYREDLDEDSAPPSSAFAVTVGSGERPVIAVWITGNTVWLTLDAAATAADTVLASYTTPPGGTSRIQDTEGNAAASFSGEAVDNQTQDP